MLVDVAITKVISVAYYLVVEIIVNQLLITNYKLLIIEAEECHVNNNQYYNERNNNCRLRAA